MKYVINGEEYANFKLEQLRKTPLAPSQVLTPELEKSLQSLFWVLTQENIMEEYFMELHSDCDMVYLPEVSSWCVHDTLLDQAFSWDDTEGGSEFWSAIDDEIIVVQREAEFLVTIVKNRGKAIPFDPNVNETI